MSTKKRFTLTSIATLPLVLIAFAIYANPGFATAPKLLGINTSSFPVITEDTIHDFAPEITEDSTITAVTSKDSPPSLKDERKSTITRNTTTMTAGRLTSVELTNVAENKATPIEIPEHPFTSIAIQFSSTDLEYSTDGKTWKTPEIADDIQPFENYITSELIEIDSSKVSDLSIRASKSQPYVKVDFIQPVSSEDLAKVQNTTKLSRSLNSTAQYNRDSGAKYTSLGIISRDEWGANPPAWDPYDHSDIDDPSRFVWMPYYHPISRITVHHTASANNPSDPAAAVRSFYIYHAHSRGWGDIGYAYLIDQYGRIYEGKAGGDEVYSYHAYTEANAMSTSISLIGNFEYAYPSSSAQSSLIRLMAEKAALYDFNLVKANGSSTHWLNSAYTVFGHRDTYYWDGGWHRNATACPGYYLNAILPSLTSSAQSYKNSHFGAIKNTVAQVNQDMNQVHQPDILYVTFNISYNASEDQVLALVPSFSGIAEIEVDHNTAKLYIRDWENGGYSVPPYGWDGYNAPGTFFPPAEGTEDRLRTLLTIFRLDPYVIGADLDYQRELPEIPEETL